MMRFLAPAILSLVAASGGAVAAPLPDPDAPVVARASAGPCRMTVFGASPYFMVKVTGLQPNEPLEIISNSEGEVLRQASTAERGGEYLAVVIPFVKGKSFGSATYTVSGRRCRIEASFPWRE